METLASTFQFKKQASRPINAITLIYDLEGFSRFFNQPDVQDYVPTFLNTVSNAISICLFGGKQYWVDPVETGTALGCRVVHEKFMGDGALYIILPPEGKSDFSGVTLQNLCNRLWNLKDSFHKVVEKSLDQIPVVDIPKKIRFGLSRGSVYALEDAGRSSPEYIGFCINLAARLQSYCRQLGFIASARLMLPIETLTEHGYRKAIATKIKGFANEIVIIDDVEFTGLPPEVRDELFDSGPFSKGGA